MAMRRVRPSTAAVALALVLTGCGSGAVDPSASPDAGPTTPTLELTATPTPTGSDTDPSSPTSSAEPGDANWRSLRIPPGPARGKPRALTEGFDGGLLALTEQVDPRPGDQGFSGSKMVVWQVTSDGRLDPAFAGDGSLTYTRGNPYEQWDIGGFERRRTDGSLILLSAVADSGSDQRASAYRITPEGIVDEGYHAAHDPVLDRADEAQYAMTTIGDGAVRFCEERGDRIDLYGIAADGTEDERLGPEGRRQGVVAGEVLCGDVATSPAGDLVVGYGQLLHLARCTRDIPVQIAVSRFDASGTRDPSWGGQPLPAAPQPRGSGYQVYAIHEIAVAADGSVFAAGVARPVDDCGNPTGDDAVFLAHTDPDGRWDLAFGDDGFAWFGANVQVAGVATNGDRVVVAGNEWIEEPGSARQAGIVWVFDATTGRQVADPRRFDDRYLAGPVIQGSVVAVFATGAIERFPLGS